MSEQYVAITIGFFVLLYIMYKYVGTLSEGMHTMLKYGFTGFSLVLWYILTLFMNAAADSLANQQVQTITGNLIYWYGTFMVLVFMYLMYDVLLQVLNWNNWKKKTDPFSKDRSKYFK